MKEATGELNMTVVVVIAIAAIAAIAALFYAFIWPSIEAGLKNNTCSTMHDASGNEYTYKDGQCCPKDGADGACIDVEDED